MIDWLSRFLEKLLKRRKRKNVQRLIKNEQLVIGDFTYGQFNLSIENYHPDSPKIDIGKFCSISTGVSIITGGIHRIDWVSSYPFRAKLDLEGKHKDGQTYSKGGVSIGNDVWIATGVNILSGVKIGDGAIIAAYSLVQKDVPPFAIVGGVPAKIIGYRFSKEIREELLKIKWWDWEIEKIKKNIDFLQNPLDSIDDIHFY